MWRKLTKKKREKMANIIDKKRLKGREKFEEFSRTFIHSTREFQQYTQMCYTIDALFKEVDVAVCQRCEHPAETLIDQDE